MAKTRPEQLVEQIETLLGVRHPELQWTAHYSANPYGDRVLRLTAATPDGSDQAISTVSWDRAERANTHDELGTFVDEIAAPLVVQLI